MFWIKRKVDQTHLKKKSSHALCMQTPHVSTGLFLKDDNLGLTVKWSEQFAQAASYQEEASCFQEVLAVIKFL